MATPRPRGESILHVDRSPGRVMVELEDLDALFDRDSAPNYPHTRPMLNTTVTKFMVDAVREDRRSQEIEVGVALRVVRHRPEDESGAQAKLSSFFANEVELAQLGQRVNRLEAWGSLRYALPVLAIAGVIAALLANPSILGVPGYLTELAYLAVVVVIWVMVWDPVEKLLFDSFFIRLRIRALRKLVAAKVVFTYRPGPPVPAGPVSDEPSSMDSLQSYLGG